MAARAKVMLVPADFSHADLKELFKTASEAALRWKWKYALWKFSCFRPL